MTLKHFNEFADFKIIRMLFFTLGMFKDKTKSRLKISRAKKNQNRVSNTVVTKRS